MKTWKLETLYVARNEQGVIVEIRQQLPQGYEPADPGSFMMLRGETELLVKKTDCRVIGD